jgi:hypothetical protein
MDPQSIRYNLIDHVDLVMNGQVIRHLRGEWLKLYSYMTHNADKRAIIDQMTERQNVTAPMPDNRN